MIKTYIRIATDIAFVLDACAAQLRILLIAGAGSLSDISDIPDVHDGNADIIRSDALSFLRTHASASRALSIGYLAKLFGEESHILVRSEIAVPADPAGQKINLDACGCGTAPTDFATSYAPRARSTRQ